MAENELKSCPFCGSNAQLNEYYGRESVHFVARCVSCEAQIYGEDREMTVEAWNRRANDGRE